MSAHLESTVACYLEEMRISTNNPLVRTSLSPIGQERIGMFALVVSLSEFSKILSMSHGIVAYRSAPVVKGEWIRAQLRR